MTSESGLWLAKCARTRAQMLRTFSDNMSLPDDIRKFREGHKRYIADLFDLLASKLENDLRVDLRATVDLLVYEPSHSIETSLIDLQDRVMRALS